MIKKIIIEKGIDKGISEINFFIIHINTSYIYIGEAMYSNVWSPVVYERIVPFIPYVNVPIASTFAYVS